MENTLASREEFIARVEELIKNGDGPFSVVVADIDNLENINRTCGQVIGDGVVKKLTSVFSQNLSSIDMLMRQGDEFNILLERKGAERGFMEMEEIRRHLSDNTFSFK